MSATIDWEPGDALVFAQVVDDGSFTAAARALGLPKSTVSRRVSRLEERLGVQLLRRTTRRLSLTDAGRAFYRGAHQASEALAEAERMATAQLDEPVGRLRVTAPVELGTDTFEALLGFAETYPRVQLDLELTNRYVNMVEEGYDVALRGGLPPEGTLTGRLVVPTLVWVVASPAYLRARGTPATPADLADHDGVIFPRWAPGGAWTLTGPDGREVQATVRDRLTVNNLEGVRRALLAGLGVGLMLERHCRDDVAQGRLTRVLSDHDQGGPGLWVVYSRTRYLSAKVRAFVDYMCDVF